MSAELTPDEAQVRRINAGIADNYDQIIYDPPADLRMDPAFIRPLMAGFGLNTDPVDLLDLACGSGSNLELLASGVEGRVVGIDISSKACELARRRFEVAGRSAEIRCQDLLDVDPDALGQFDVISCVGVYYVVPEPVREKLVEIISRCLRPGGVALISYYSGLVGDINFTQRRLIRSNTAPNASPQEQVAQARSTLRQLITAAEQTGAPPVVKRSLESFLRQPPEVLFHELFGGGMHRVSTIELNKLLEPHGLGVINYLPCGAVLAHPTPAQRALALEAIDMMRGGYRYVVFGRWEDEPQPFRADHPRLVWRSSLTPAPEQKQHGYLARDGKSLVTVASPSTRAFVAATAEAALPWGEAIGRAKQILAASGSQDAPDENAIFADVLQLWSMGVVRGTIDDAPEALAADMPAVLASAS